MDPTYWKRYVVETDVDDIERTIAISTCVSERSRIEFLRFDAGRDAPSILISPGSGGHAHVFAELGYHMHTRGYNVFVMPKQGGRTIVELIRRHEDALGYVAEMCNPRIGIFGEGLGGFVTFYLALGGSRAQTIVCQNSPAILNEHAWHQALIQGNGAARRRQLILPLAKVLTKVVPGLPVPISAYLDFRELIDVKEENRRIETPMVERYLHDPEFDRQYRLSAVVSLLLTPPPGDLAELKTPTMFLVPVRGFVSAYVRDLYERLPPIKKRFVEVDGGAFWMCSHPRDAAGVICEWFDETL